MKTKSALSWFGSDSEAAPALASMLDGCDHVTIPFVGGASILRHLSARAIVCNDLHDLAINFYRVMGQEGRRELLIDRCIKTLSHPAEMDFARQLLDSEKSSEIQKAWAFWAQCWIGRKGKGGTRHIGGNPSVRMTPRGGTNATRIKTAAADLEHWAKHFERCEWVCGCFRELLPKVADNPDCGLYIDAPWVKAGRNYLHSFTQKDHFDLAGLAYRFEKTRVVVRYDDCPTVRDLYRDDQWTITEAKTRTQAGSDIGEVWITNFTPSLSTPGERTE